jgi:hypothetical protein
VCGESCFYDVRRSTVLRIVSGTHERQVDWAHLYCDESCFYDVRRSTVLGIVSGTHERQVNFPFRRLKRVILDFRLPDPRNFS